MALGADLKHPGILRLDEIFLGLVLRIVFVYRLWVPSAQPVVAVVVVRLSPSLASPGRSHSDDLPNVAGVTVVMMKQLGASVLLC